MRTLLVLFLSGCAIGTPSGEPCQKHQEHESFVQVRVDVPTQSPRPNASPDMDTFLGSGFAVANRGAYSFVLTAGHICLHGRPGGGINVLSFKGRAFPAVPIFVNEKEDMCVLLAKGFLPGLKLAERRPLVGDLIHTMSAPEGIFTPGMVLIFDGRYAGVSSAVNFAGYTVPAATGSSGSPILNSSGEVIGMVTSVRSDFSHLGLGPPFEQVQALIKAIRIVSARTKSE